MDGTVFESRRRELLLRVDAWTLLAKSLRTPPDRIHATGSMQTEYAFTLPRGYRDGAGTEHREGTMRLATPRDEIEVQHDRAVRGNEAYLTMLLLARVITPIGPVTDVGPGLVEELYAADLDHLQRLYERLNTDESVGVVACPECRHEFEVNLSEIQDGPPGK